MEVLCILGAGGGGVGFSSPVIFFYIVVPSFFIAPLFRRTATRSSDVKKAARSRFPTSQGTYLCPPLFRPRQCLHTTKG